MLSYDPPSPPPLERSAPFSRGLWCWPALLPAAALVLDATWPLPVGGLLWLDLAALACLGWAALGPRRAPPRDWATPMDGRIAAGFVLALLHVIQVPANREPMVWVHQIAASGICFYALGARLRREALAPDAIWPAFAGIVLVLAAFTLASATQGLEAISLAAARVDRNWASHDGLAKTLLLATVLCIGRAMEPSARPLWRVTALVGAMAFVLQAVPNGVGLGVDSLASLDEPFYFGTSIIAILFLAGLARAAWLVGRERLDEAWRWRAATVAFALVTVLLLLGGTTGGEGVRVLTALAGSATIASGFAPRPATTARLPRESEPTARAA